MNIQSELLTKTEFKREFKRRVLSNPLTNPYLKIASCDLDSKEKKLLNETYKKVKSIESMIQKNWIENIDGANRMKEISRSMTISRMVRNRIADVDILTEEFITLEEVEQEYAIHYHRSQLITETILKHEFIQNAITELAKDGKPFKSKNHDEIVEIEIEIYELEFSLLTGMSVVKKVLINNRKQLLERRHQELKDDDFLNSEFPIEDICYKIVADIKAVNMSGDSITEFDSKSFENCIWFFSKTAQNKLRDMIVNSYKSMYEDEISAYRKKKNNEHRKESMKKYNKKLLSAEDKLELVQLGKAEGITQKEVAAQIGCSVRTVQIYWNTAS